MDLFDIPQCGLRLYGGATWSPNKPFSFVPCHQVTGAPCSFPRPVIEPSGILSDMIKPSRKQWHKITAVASQEHATAIWDAVVRQVLSQGCVLGTTVDEPPDTHFLSANQLHSEAIIGAADGKPMAFRPGELSSI
ncbi:MAG TPA: hypothetical protein VGM07_06130 [Stellaceae bacterium]|jgi:hypothetical protein